MALAVVAPVTVILAARLADDFHRNRAAEALVLAAPGLHEANVDALR